MFKIITVEREYGARGSLLAAELARRKGWELLDQHLTCEIAKLAGVHEKAVARHFGEVRSPNALPGEGLLAWQP